MENGLFRGIVFALFVRRKYAEGYLDTHSSSRFGYFAAKVGCCVTRDGWPRDVGGWADEGLGTCRRVGELAGGGWLEG